MKAKIDRVVLPILLIAIFVATTSMTVKACVPPSIKILSPKNMIYATSSIPLTFTVDKATSWIGYALDGQANVTISGNTTLTALQDGAHYVIVYANDTDGRMGASCQVCFSVDTTPPDIKDISQFPLKDNVLPEDDVKVNATVTDEVSGVKRVILFYAYANSSGTWIRVVNMTNLEGNIWNAVIPSFPYCTNVTYTISAEDNVGNAITTTEMGYDIQYHVIPELTSFLILLLFMATALVAIPLLRKRSREIGTIKK
jgi:hypothetical protein